MKKGRTTLTLTLSLFAASVAWAQGNENQPPPPAPVPAFGQQSPAPSASENPPISAIDQPGLEPHAAPESFLLPGLHFSESVDSNLENSLGQSSVGTVTRGIGSLTLQKLWKSDALALDYIGGVAYYARSGIGLEQLEQFDFDDRISWERGQLAFRDSFSYLPEGSFSFGAYGGGGAYSSGFGSLGAGMLGASAFGAGSSAFTGGNNISLGEVPRLTNLGLVDVVEDLTPKSSVTFAAGYGIEHFYGSVTSTYTGAQENIYFIGSREFTAQAAYDRILNAKDQVALSYGYQGFDFSSVGTAFHSNVIQAMYGHRISGRMDFMIAAGPQFTHISANEPICTLAGLEFPPSYCTPAPGNPIVGTFIVVPEEANHIGVAGRLSLRYKFPKTSLNLSFQRYDTSGSGIFAGSESNIAQLDVQRPLSRVWNLFSDFGYSKNAQLQLAGSAVNASDYTSGYAGVGLHRQFGRNLRGFVSYQFDDLFFNTTCPVPLTSSTAGCSNTSHRHEGSIGLDWTPRPIRLD
jgi:hypothetical protein